MCLAMPALVRKVDGDQAEVEMGGNVWQVKTGLVPNLKPGDYVLLHAGFALEKIDPEQAEETLRLLEEAYGEAANS
ncbi:MAG TPA: HypC/HybG/HupF family hydrogenase formation chaperone [Firmicutes bacterium]|jgi:hydrogenase expression/formation protein HypC|nr:HypC/HybG/HupF family hydrogenase formation chaperone [Bacillota bacterium]